MKKVLMMALALTMCAGAASADHFGLYQDVTGLSCTLLPPASVPFPVYVVHKFSAGAGAAQFKVTDTSGFLALNQTTIAGLALGAWNTDWSIAYGAACLGAGVDLHIATLNFLYFGAPPLSCANAMEIAPAPTSPVPGAIALVDCAGGFRTATGGRIFFAGGCVEPTGCDPLGVSETTWGGVKALYR